MADSTTASITVNASPDAVLAVIADFEAYPEWTGAVKKAEILGRRPDGRAELVHYQLDAGAIKDEYTLTYDWSQVPRRADLDPRRGPDAQGAGRLLRARRGRGRAGPTSPTRSPST